MKFNSDPSFVGIKVLQRKHAAQIVEFEQWAVTGVWENFHDSHYDWWVFPIDQPSRFGYQWVVYAGEVAELKQDKVFIDHYLTGVRLVSASWGWDVMNASYITDPAPGQAWHAWPVRLYKAARSVELFGYHDLFTSLQTYALDLIRQGESIEFNGRDLSRFFLNLTNHPL